VLRSELCEKIENDKIRKHYISHYLLVKLLKKWHLTIITQD
jgi:hypothetical protein